MRKIENPTPGTIPETFDKEYYDDQRDPKQRIRFMELMKVTKEFKKNQKAIEKHLANQAARKKSAYGEIKTGDFSQEIDPALNLEYEQLSESSQSSAEEKLGKQRNTDEVVFSIKTRSKVQQLMNAPHKQFESKGNQSTESLLLEEIQKFPSITTRMRKKGRSCNPSYLQAGLLMMALCNESPNQAVMNMYIMDTVIYQQTRHLPLRLRKEYQRELNFLKKYNAASKRGDTLLSSIIPDEVQDTDEDTDHGDDLEEESEDFSVQDENESEAWANEVLDEDALNYTDGMYDEFLYLLLNIYLEALRNEFFGTRLSNAYKCRKYRLPIN